MKLIRLAGATSEIWQIFIADSSSTTGAGLTALTSGSSGLTAYFHRDTDTTATAISLTTMTLGTFTSSGFLKIDDTNMPGWYQFCPPNAAIAAGAKSCSFLLKGATNMAPLPIEVQLVAYDPNDAVRLGLTALPNVASGSAGAIPTTGTGANQIQVNGSGKVSGVVLTDTLTTYTGNTVQTGDSFARIGAAGAGLTGVPPLVWDVVLASHLTAGTTGNALNAAGSAGDPWATAIPGAYGAGTAGSKLGRLPDVAVGAAGGLFIAGSNAATTVNITGNLTGNVSGSVGSVTTVSDKTGYSMAAAGLDAVVVSDLGAVPSTTAKIVDAIAFLFMGLRNLRSTTASQDKVSNNAGTAIGTATVSDDGTTFLKGKYA